ncbi:MAG TPA: sulfotransferase, partial [Solirubrobacteraceae bacterium]
MAIFADSVAAARATGQRLPDFFIVGQSKSGTTALYEILREHPQIYMPVVKEPVFLASDHHAGLWKTVPTRPRTLTDYLALFDDARPEQQAGEASSVYLWSRIAAANIAEVQPDARIIAIFREPASFLRSLHLQMLQNHVETVKDFARALELEPARREGKRI